MNILFTCACGNKSEKLFKIIKKNFRQKINLYGCDVKKKIEKSYLDNFFQIDFKNEQKFIKQLLHICIEYRIDFLFASADREIDCLSKNSKKFNKIKTKILINNYKYTKIFNDKFKTYEALRKIKVEVPRYKLIKKMSNVNKILNEFDYPNKSVIIKSRQGIGGRGVYLLLGKQKSDQINYKWFGNYNREKKIFFFKFKNQT